MFKPLIILHYEELELKDLKLIFSDFYLVVLSYNELLFQARRRERRKWTRIQKLG